ncbi:MAG TPA: hypothetical protein VMW16_02330 [Sedimentisphaerales bacterium]|nr:hypothetical protein [Sedimentisphaerales bacterium]
MGKVRILSVALAIAASATASASQKIDLSRAKVVVLNPQKKIEAKAADMLRDEVEKRTRIGLEVVSKMPGEDEAAILIGTAGEMAEKSYRPAAGFEVPSRTDGYAIWIDTSKRQAATICAAGYDDRGTLFAAGRLLRLLEMSRDKVRLDREVKVATAPKYALRGHQFGYRPKTNSYDGWTIEMWEQYYRDMVVFGMNALELVPPETDDDKDSPHFPKPKLEMMIAMSQLADDYGLDVWIWYPVVEYDVDGGEITAAIAELALKNRDEVLSKLARVDAIFVPSGDPDEVHPKYLFPHMEKLKKILNRYHPNATIWSSIQNYDDEDRTMGWIKEFYDRLKSGQADWLDGVVFGPATETTLPQMRRDVPARFPIRRYPDITHSKRCQYEVPDWDRALRNTLGREPINPRPRAYAKIFRDLQQYSIGFITYSEGCNDDLNKVVWSCLGWDPDMKVEDIVREYSRYFIGRDFEQSFADGIFGLERNWAGPLKDNEGVYETLKLFQQMEKKATPQDKLNWRFQQGLYRAYYDAYVKARLEYETDLERQAVEVLKRAEELGSLKALDEAEAILNKGVTDRTRPEWRARAFELAEALFQSIRMQMSVPKYKAKEVSRGANLDLIDAPLNNSKELKDMFADIRRIDSEKERLAKIGGIAAGRYKKGKYDWEKVIEDTFEKEL